MVTCCLKQILVMQQYGPDWSMTPDETAPFKLRPALQFHFQCCTALHPMSRLQKPSGQCRLSTACTDLAISERHLCLLAGMHHHCMQYSTCFLMPHSKAHLVGPLLGCLHTLTKGCDGQHPASSADNVSCSVAGCACMEHLPSTALKAVACLPTPLVCGLSVWSCESCRCEGVRATGIALACTAAL